MPRTIRRQLARWLLTPVLIGLVACGGATAGSDATSAPAVSSAPAASVAASASPATSASVAASGDLSGRYAGIPQSRTAEGYYMLGEPTAPVVLTHYSDFL